MTFLYNIGLYILMLQKMFQKPTKWRVMKDLILKDTEDTVVNSLGIISFVSFFIGGVITIHMGEIHDYLGVDPEFDKPGELKISLIKHL